ncbi:MAG: esterase-like activity of phytase family protein [Steroidobacteraceae bacterium]
MPAATFVDSYRFGGISGLDYDQRSGHWYMVSDDRTEYSAARIFDARLTFDAQGVNQVVLQEGRLASDEAATDAEAIRVDPRRRDLVVGGEGDAARQVGPWLRRLGFSGNEIERLRLPAPFDATFGNAQRGPRANGSIEGIAFDVQGRGLWIALETPLLQDGPAATVESGAQVRLTLMGRAGDAIIQHVYQVDAARAHAAGESSDSGVSEILALDSSELLVLERSGIRHADGGFRFHTRLYCADLTGATDVAAIDSLAGRPYRSVAKRLLYDFDSWQGLQVDNLEGMSWGPVLARRKRSLVFVSDNNLAPQRATQLLFFAVAP